MSSVVSASSSSRSTAASRKQLIASWHQKVRAKAQTRSGGNGATNSAQPAFDLVFVQPVRAALRIRAIANPRSTDWLSGWNATFLMKEEAVREWNRMNLCGIVFPFLGS
jgi:hypothetical protein